MHIGRGSCDRDRRSRETFRDLDRDIKRQTERDGERRRQTDTERKRQRVALYLSSPFQMRFRSINLCLVTAFGLSEEKPQGSEPSTYDWARKKRSTKKMEKRSTKKMETRRTKKRKKRRENE